MATLSIVALQGLLLWLTLLFTLVESAGVGIHTTVVSRIHGTLPDELKSPDLLPYLLTGSFFPDAFYSCGNHNASEYLHWPPFLHSAVEFYHEKYQGIPNLDLKEVRKALELKAFLYGIFSHQVTDSSWHSIRLSEGLLKTLAHLDFDGDTNAAHQFLDTAGDFLYLLKIKDQSFYQTQFVLPDIDDLVELFKRGGFEVSKSSIIYCTASGEKGLKSELRLAPYVGPVYSKSSPLLDDILDSFYLGGLQEITQSTIKCIPNLNNWFTNPNKHIDPWNLCGAIIEGPYQQSLSPVRHVKTLEKGANYISSYIPLSQFGHSISVGNYLQEPSLAIGANQEESDGAVYILAILDFITQSKIDTRVIHPLNRGHFRFPKRFGSSVITVNILGQDFLVVNEPGSSNLYIYSENRRVLTITDNHSRDRYGSNGFKEEHTFLTTFDFEGDGFPSIITGSPYIDDGDEPHRGLVSVISGSKLAFILLRSGYNEEKIVDIALLREKTIKLPDVLKLEDGYEQFGSVVASDNNYIYVTANGLGSIIVLDHDGQYEKSIYKEKIESSTSGVRVKSKNSERFGANWIVTGTFDGIDYLFTGVHRSSGIASTSSGSVYVYTVQNKVIEFHTVLTLDLRGANSFAKFGCKAIVQNDVLFISAPGYQTGGAVFQISISSILASNAKHIVVDKIATQNELEVYTGFGESLASTQNLLIVGEPQYGFDELFKDEFKLFGRVRLYTI